MSNVRQPDPNKLFQFYRSDIGDYMHRWIFQHPWGTVRVHHILRSDNDRHPHDHPWNFVSLILSGSYKERLFTEYTSERNHSMLLIFSPGMINRKKATDMHVLTLDKPVWTFVISGPRLRTWGFHTPDGFIPWREYEAYLERSTGDAGRKII